MGFEKVAETSEIPSGSMKKVSVMGREILIANVGGKYYAIGNVCTHMKGDLSEGILDANIITCPKHKQKFEVTSGKSVEGPKTLLFSKKGKDEPKYEVKVEGDDILVSTE